MQASISGEVGGDERGVDKKFKSVVRILSVVRASISRSRHSCEITAREVEGERDRGEGRSVELKRRKRFGGRESLSSIMEPIVDDIRTNASN